MRGRRVFMDSLQAHGVRHLFGNPGTTESPLIDSLGDYPQIDYVVALHEGLAVGAAAYYAQASGRTGVVNLHVAPGLGNAIGMIYGAWKANAPLIVTAGQQDTRMRLRDPLLGHDLAAMAAPVTKWSTQVERADELADLMRRAFKIANDPPFGPVFVALPIDVLEQETENAALAPSPLRHASHPDPVGLAQAGELLSRARKPVIVAGDDVARAGADGALLRLAERLGAEIWAEGLRAQAVAPSAHPAMRGALPFTAGQIARALADTDCVLLAGGPFFEEVWFDPESPFPDGAAVLQIEESPERLGRNYPLTLGLLGGLAPALEALADTVAPEPTAAAERNAALAARRQEEREAQAGRVERARARRPMAMSLAMAVLAESLPSEAVLVEESITASIDFARSIPIAGPGHYFSGRGGGIGQGLAGAVGVATAKPGQPVVCVSGDGSAMYSIQALWSAAHHNLPVVFVILANREYRVLKHNIDLYRSRFGNESNRDYAHMDLATPDLGFVEMARGMGVEGERVSEPDDFAAALETAFAAGTPRLIEVVIEGKA